MLESQDDAESGGLVIGDLIIHLFRRAGDAVLPVLPQLLHAMVARMPSAKTAQFLQVRQTQLSRTAYMIDLIPLEPCHPIRVLDQQPARYSAISPGGDGRPRPFRIGYSHSNVV